MQTASRLRKSACRSLIATALPLCLAGVFWGASSFPALEAANAAGPYTINPDCPYRLLNAYNSPNYSDRCMGGLYAMSQVGAGSWYDYNRCAIAKYNANGSGGDAFTAACGTGLITVTPCYGASTKYPGVVDHGPNAHTGYHGQLVTSVNDC
jgi:hypothetical protein